MNVTRTEEVWYHTFNAQEPVSLSLSARRNWWARSVGIRRLFTQCLPDGCILASSKCAKKSSKLFSLACRKCSSSAADTIRNSLMALTFPLIIPVKPLIADSTSVSRPDPFISVPIHPRKDMIMCIAPDLRITSLRICPAPTTAPVVQPCRRRRSVNERTKQVDCSRHD